MSDIQSLIGAFTNQLTAALESDSMERARQAVETTFGARRPGRPAKLSPIANAGKPRKKAPLQLCPVPGCKKPAAPVFGMVCAKHKDVAKAKIKKFRDARKAKKAKAALPAPRGSRAGQCRTPNRRSRNGAATTSNVP